MFKQRFVHSNSVLIKNGLLHPFSKRQGKSIIVDPGITAFGNSSRLLSKLNELGVQAIDEIWLTHAHPDHSQAVRFLKSKFNSKVFCHPIAKTILESPHPVQAVSNQQKESVAPLLTHIFKNEPKKAKVIEKITESLTKLGVNSITLNWRKVKVDGIFKNGELLNGIKVLYLPGHTPEEVGFYITNENILITGDLIAHGKHIPFAVLNMPSSDIDAAISSLKIIQGLNPKLIITGHGGVIENPKAVIDKCIEATKKLRLDAICTLRTSSNPAQVISKWWQLSIGCRIQERLCLLGVFAKATFKLY
ncbi:MAG: MBL fold metallo-hydrolase [bacterium]|nr:MBL fold metallo-hydrolase [bacterium]